MDEAGCAGTHLRSASTRSRAVAAVACRDDLAIGLNDQRSDCIPGFVKRAWKGCAHFAVIAEPCVAQRGIAQTQQAKLFVPVNLASTRPAEHNMRPSHRQRKCPGVGVTQRLIRRFDFGEAAALVAGKTHLRHRTDSAASGQIEPGAGSRPCPQYDGMSRIIAACNRCKRIAVIAAKRSVKHSGYAVKTGGAELRL